MKYFVVIAMGVFYAFGLGLCVALARSTRLAPVYNLVGDVWLVTLAIVPLIALVAYLSAVAKRRHSQ